MDPKIKGSATLKVQTTGYSLKRLIVTSLVTGVIGYLFAILTPLGQYFIERLKTSLMPLDLRVDVYSVLISREQHDPVADLKLRIRIQNAELSAQSVQLIFLKNVITGDSVDLTPSPSIEISARSFERDSLTIRQSGDWHLFQQIPSFSVSSWSLGYRVLGQQELYNPVVDSTELYRLHYFMLPYGKWRPSSDTMFQPVVLHNVRRIFELDKNEWLDRGDDSFRVMIYPPDKIVLGFDSNDDDRTDTSLLASDLVIDSMKGVSGGVISISPILDHYFFDKVSGFLFAIGGKEIVPDSIGFEWFSPERQKDLSRVFGAIVDEQIPLVGKEFIYWQYRIE